MHDAGLAKQLSIARRAPSWSASPRLVLLVVQACFAQQPTNSWKPPYDYHHMWGDRGAWRAGMVFRPIEMLLIVVVALIVLLMRGAGYGCNWYGHGDWPS